MSMFESLQAALQAGSEHNAGLLTNVTLTESGPCVARKLCRQQIQLPHHYDTH
jgi:hypothetical protein